MEEITLILTATSDLSSETATQIFTVIFIDGCGDVTLSPPGFSDIIGEAELYATERFFFTESEANVQNCGAISYRILDENTGLELPSPDFTIDLSGNIPFVQVQATSPIYAQNSPYALVIEASIDNYATVESEPLELIINDPCFDTQLI